MASSLNLQPPPLQIDVLTEGKMTEPWRTFFRDLVTAVSTGAAPSDAQYWVSTADAQLTAERNLGALIAGYLKITVALGVATPVSTATIPASDLVGALPALDGSALTNLNASALASGTVPDARFPATLPAVSGVNLTSLTGANVNHSLVSKVFADSGYVALVDQTVLVDATGGATTIKLPAPVSGKFVFVAKTDASGNAVTVDGNGHNIDGAASQSLPAQWSLLGMQSDGTNWVIVAIAGNVVVSTGTFTANDLIVGASTGTRRIGDSGLSVGDLALLSQANDFSGSSNIFDNELILLALLTLTGGQIAFPATQVPSSGVNTLDDYEEGTWTPADASASALSLTVNAAHYIKIGKLVVLSASIVYPVSAAAVNNLIGGLPFTVDTATSMWGGAITATNSSLALLVQALSNTTTMHFTASNGLAYFNSQLSTFAFDFVMAYQATA